MLDTIYGHKKDLTCDNCGKGMIFETFEDCMVFIADEDWKIETVNGEWFHYCSECKEGEEMDFVPELFLYVVTIVDDDDAYIEPVYVVAQSEEGAKHKADVYAELDANGEIIDDVDVIVQRIGYLPKLTKSNKKKIIQSP